MKKPQAGFTLTELMVILAIIGIIAALAIPSLMRARELNGPHKVENAAFEKPSYDYDLKTNQGFLLFRVWVNKEYVWARVSLSKVAVRVRDDKQEWTTVSGTYVGQYATTEWTELEILVPFKWEKEYWEKFLKKALVDSQERARQETPGTPKRVAPPEEK